MVTKLEFLPCLASLLVSAGVGLAVTTQAGQSDALVEGNTAFALDLYSHLRETPGNLFFSPCSISTCLGMTYAGARGNTENQMGRVLHFSQGQKGVHASFLELQQQLHDAEKETGVQLDIANALWTQKGEPFLPAFLKTATDDYQANVKQADFKTGADAVTAEINRWVVQKTHDRIQDILQPGDLDATTRIVLANAIYFKGAWASPFRVAATSTQTFHLSGQAQTDALLMGQIETVNYIENLDFQTVALPYASNQLEMVIMLPRQIEAIGELEKRLTPGFLADVLAKMEKRRVQVFLPKFKLALPRYQLAKSLAKMGMPDAFGPKGDFSGMNGDRGPNKLFVSEVIHKAWIEVKEEGTEAAAATVVPMMAGSAPAPSPPPAVFRADHPFIFLIRETRSGSLLFIGRMADPRSRTKNHEAGPSLLRELAHFK